MYYGNPLADSLSHFDANYLLINNQTYMMDEEVKPFFAKPKTFTQIADSKSIVSIMTANTLSFEYTGFLDDSILGNDTYILQFTELQTNYSLSLGIDSFKIPNVNACWIFEYQVGYFNGETFDYVASIGMLDVSNTNSGYFEVRATNSTPISSPVDSLGLEQKDLNLLIASSIYNMTLSVTQGASTLCTGQYANIMQPINAILIRYKHYTEPQSDSSILNLHYNTLPLDLKNDFDGDGLNNTMEINYYLSDPWNIDSDGDGLIDGYEPYNATYDNLLHYDTDNDLLSDFDETYIWGTNTQLADTDQDGLSDYWEIMNYLNPFEINANSDFDHDGLTNWDEYLLNTLPVIPDSDYDGMPDGYENGIAILNPLINDASNDPDNDDLTNLDEYLHGTNPNDSDTDDDGLIDGNEVNTIGTDPNNPDTDGDGLTDGYELDISSGGTPSDPLNPYDPYYIKPAVPIVLEVANEPSLNVSWQSVSFADYYEVYVNSNPICFGSTTNLTIIITGLEYMTMYSIRIRAFTNAGYYSDYSNYVQQTTFTPLPSTPTGLASPSQTYNSIYLTWDSSQYATYYEIYIGGECIGTTTNCYFTATELESDTSYSFRILAGNSKGESDFTTNIVVYTTPPPPETPTGLTSPSQTSTTIDLTWDASSGATSYQIYCGATLVGTTSYCSFTITGLSPDHSYYISLKALNQYGSSSPTSILVYTTIAPPETPAYAPTYSNVGSTTLTVTILPVLDATSYKLYKNGVYYCTTTSTTISVTGLSPNTGYNFKYTACNDGGSSGYSPSSSVTTSTIVPNPPNVYPPTSGTTSSITLSWGKPSNVDTTSGLSYEIYMKIGSTWTLIRTQAHSGALSATQAYTKTGLTTGVTYYFRFYTVFNGVKSTSYSSTSCMVSTGGGWESIDSPEIIGTIESDDKPINNIFYILLVINIIGLIFALLSLNKRIQLKKLNNRWCL